MELAKPYFKDEKFKIRCGFHYLGGHIGEGRDDYVTEKVLEWVESVQKFLPTIRQNLQRVNDVDPEKYAVLDSIIQSELVPALFDMDGIPIEFDWLFTLHGKD
eukprot:1919872-Ditylum_brightwellii.AAC.1